MGLVEDVAAGSLLGFARKALELGNSVHADAWPDYRETHDKGPDEDLEELRSIAGQTGRSVTDGVREAVRRVWLRPDLGGPAALWEGTRSRTSVEHDAIYDEI